MIQQPENDAAFLGWLCPPPPRSGVGEFGCLLAENETPVLILLVAALAVGLWYAWQWWERRQAVGKSLIVFPLEGTGPRDHPAPKQLAEPVSSSESFVAPGAAWPPEPAPPTTEPAAPPAGPASPTGTAPPPAGPAPPIGLQGNGRGTAAPAPQSSSPAAPGSTPTPQTYPPAPPSPEAPSESPSAPRVTVAGGPMDGTLQLLPGRLELVAGGSESMAREVRFVRVPGQEPEVTFGRDEGAPFVHIRLNLPTVSRRQARLRFRDGRWILVNESGTNPTLVAGEPVPTEGGGRVLADGDRVDMGTVVYRFHQPGATGEVTVAESGLPERSSWFSDQGRRATNQDAVAVRTLPDGRELAVICDGIGSHSEGRVASHLALDVLMDTLEGGAGLRAGVLASHRAIQTRVEDEPDLKGIGTTMVAVLRDRDRYELANVGDSRAYRLDSEGITSLTRDHSFAAEVRRDGTMSEEELARSPWRNAITRHLGEEGELEVDLFGPFQVKDAHMLILCSDGLYGVVDSDAIAAVSRRAVVTEGGVRNVARALGEEALRRGGDDNVSVVALTFTPGAMTRLGGGS